MWCSPPSNRSPLKTPVPNPKISFHSLLTTRRRRRHRGIRSSPVRPRPVGVPLRRRRRADGGGVSIGESLYRSLVPAVRHEVSLFGFCWWRGSFGLWVWQGSGAAGSVVTRRCQSASASRHPGSPGLGARPRPMDLQRLLHLAHGGGCLPWLFSKLAGDGALATCGGWRSTSGDGQRRRILEDSACRWSKDLVAFSLFSRGLCAIRSGQLSSVSCVDVSVFVHVHVRYP